VATGILGAGVATSAANALTADEAARRIFTGVGRGDFLISTHADLPAMAESRWARLRAMLAPDQPAV
jgi:hypothetical protein